MDTYCESPKWKGYAVLVASFKKSKPDEGEKDFIKEEVSSPEQVVTTTPTRSSIHMTSKSRRAI